MTRPNPADRPPTKHSSLVIDLDLALAARTAEIRQREAQLAAMVAEGYFLLRAPTQERP